MVKTLTKIGPRDHGRQMSLADFEHAQVEEGYHYELSRGVITVSDVPGIEHLQLVQALRDPLVLYRLQHADAVFAIASGSECKILLEELQSERHPDIAVYLMAPPDEKEPWATWIPELVIEVVSPSSQQRDYVEKKQEYFDFGIKEYWIVDASRKVFATLRRSRGKWLEKKLKPGDICETPLLPGFKLDVEAVLIAGKS